MLSNNSQEEPGGTEDQERSTTTRREPDDGPGPQGEPDGGRRATHRLAALRKVGRSRRP